MLKNHYQTFFQRLGQAKPLPVLSLQKRNFYSQKQINQYQDFNFKFEKAVIHIKGETEKTHQKENRDQKNNQGGDNSFKQDWLNFETFKTLFGILIGSGILMQFYNEVKINNTNKIQVADRKLENVKKNIEDVINDLSIDKVRSRENLQSIKLSTLKQAQDKINEQCRKLASIKINLSNISTLYQWGIREYGSNIKSINELFSQIQIYEGRIKLLEKFLASWILYRSSPEIPIILDIAEANANPDISRAILSLQAFAALSKQGPDYEYALAKFSEVLDFTNENDLANRNIIYTNVARTMCKLAELYGDEDKDYIIKNCLNLVSIGLKTMAKDKIYHYYNYAILLNMSNNSEAELFFERSTLNYQQFINGNKKFLELEHGDIVAQSYYMQYLINKKLNYTEVINKLKHLEKSEPISTEQGPLFYHLAIAYYNSGKRDEALKNINIAKKLLYKDNNYRDKVIIDTKTKIESLSSDQKPSVPLKSLLYNWSLSKETVDKKHKSAFFNKHNGELNKKLLSELNIKFNEILIKANIVENTNLQSLYLAKN